MVGDERRVWAEEFGGGVDFVGGGEEVEEEAEDEGIEENGS